MAKGYRFDDTPPAKGQKISVFESLQACTIFKRYAQQWKIAWT
ncbi:MAG: hypothetical protein WCF67_21420 [Chitinophagaceae bacterium]